jgi:hypothetical protein
MKLFPLFFYKTPLTKLLQISTRHSWSRGMMSACHAGDPGSIPGECILLLFFLTPKCSSVANITFHPSSVAIHVHKHFSLYFIFSNNFNWQVFKSSLFTTNVFYPFG